MALWEKLSEIRKPLPIDDENNEINDLPDEIPPTDDDEELSPDGDNRPLGTMKNRLSGSSIALNELERTNPVWWPEEHKQFSIIINKTRNDKGSERRIREHLSRQGLRYTEQDENVRPWYFGLTGIHLQFEHSQSIDTIRLTSSPSTPPFWFTFKNEEDQEVAGMGALAIAPMKAIHYGYSPQYTASLRCGALVALNQFYYSRQHSWQNERPSKWSFLLDNERNGGGHIEWIMQHADRREKKQLLAINIDRTVIINPLPNGFEMYICQTCNMNEFKAPIKPNERNDNQDGGERNSHAREGGDRQRAFERQPATNRTPSKPRASGAFRAPPPFRAPAQFVGSQSRPNYERYTRVGAQKGSYFPTVQFELRFDPNSPKKDKLREQVQRTLTLLIEFFRTRKIIVSYGLIRASEGPPPGSSPDPPLPSLITLYAWQMLLSLGYRLEIQIQMYPQFLEKLQKLSKEPNNGDDLFYRVCVYLSRLFTIQPFVDMTEELSLAEEQWRRKREESSYGFISSLHTEGEMDTYVPSITLTPTTIRIKPLKLCRTNRVLRAKEVFGKSLEHFALVDIQEENGRQLQFFYFRDLRDTFQKHLEEGFPLMEKNRIYLYLHHSQSQLRERQFWFYHHDPKTNKSFPEAYEWMGDFRREKNIAKHAARIALCFSTTKATVHVDKSRVRIKDDIKTADGRYAYTDGCGTMSTKLRNEIKKSLKISRFFSAVQFRYGGAKGVVSVDPLMPADYDLCIRESMHKFLTEHNCFEVCKLSAPRPLSLNRQAIMLLSFRGISDETFLTLQQRYHFDLIRALLRNEDAERLLREKMTRWLLPDDAPVDLIREPFFRQLVISACLTATRDLLRRTRIRVPRDKARFMIGIVDEYNVLEHDQVFIQYTSLDTPNKNSRRKPIILEGPVVITKNPCHHPGDIRTFTAISHPALKHLEDVVVFSQRGDRPAPHKISGSDLDGDEYAVIWHEELVPLTPNAQPFDHDAPKDPKKLNRPITRRDVNSAVLEIAERDCLGRLSNLHLAYADRFGLACEKRPQDGVRSTVELAGAISEEVDSGKTGYHPLTEEEIKKMNEVLENKWPDFMEKSSGEVEKSKEILGQLFRSSRRILPGWNRLLRRHRHLHHLKVRTRADPDEANEQQEEGEEEDLKDENEATLKPDRTLVAGRIYNIPEFANLATQFDYVYRQELLEILNLYGLSHESDLWCRNALVGVSGELDDSAYTELEQLISRTQNSFYTNWVSFCEGNCSADAPMNEMCKQCLPRRQGLAVACYLECYNGKNIADRATILSLPWLFATPLLLGKWCQNRPPPPSLLLSAMQQALGDLSSKRSLILSGATLNFSVPQETTHAQATVHWTVCLFIEILQARHKLRRCRSWSHILSRFIRGTPSFEWLSRQSIDSDQCRLVLRRPQQRGTDENATNYTVWLLSMNGTPDDDNLLHTYFEQLLEICYEEAALTTEDNDSRRVSELVLIELQHLAIDEKPL